MKKIRLAPWQFATGAAAFIALTNNSAFFMALLDSPETHSVAGLAFVASLFLLMTLVLDTIILVIGVGILLKITVVSLFIVSALFGYFSTELGVIFDPGMLSNMLETVRDKNAAEAVELLSLPLILHLLLFGIAPALSLGFIEIVRPSIFRDAGHRAVTLIGLGMLFIAVTLPNYRFVSYFARQHHDLQFSVMPIYPLVSSVRLIRKRLRAEQSFHVVDADASRHRRKERRTVGIMVVGETARADHFSLDGYPRDTNPLLANIPGIQFAHGRSCGTSTLFSVPCMFSVQGRDTYDIDQAAYESNVLDILHTAGVDTVWIDNNSSCKGVCARIESLNLRDEVDAHSPFYSDMGYYDEALLPRVDALLDHDGPDTLIVLHMLGSHGPAYNRRYPVEFERFKPACNNVSPTECASNEIANAYDNTILYTDFVLEKLIETLQAGSGRFDSFLFYVSDHGESLGENGIYLHGLPYAIAPDAQTVVPFVFWASPAFRGTHMNEAQLSHDNISHTLMGLFQVDASSYQSELDLFATRTSGASR